MHGYVNSLNPTAPPLPTSSSGESAFQGDLKNGTQDQTAVADNDMQNQLEELQRTVTLIFWYKAKVEPIRLQHMIPTFPLFQLSRFSSLASDLGLTPSSYLDTYNPQTGQWEQHTIGSVRVVETKQRLLYKLRKSLLEGLSEDDCLSLREEVELQLQPGQTQPLSVLIPPLTSPTPSATTTPSNSNTRLASSDRRGNLKRQAQGNPDSSPATKHRVTNAYYASNSIGPSVAATPTNPVDDTSASTHLVQPPSTSSNQNQRATPTYLYQTSPLFGPTPASDASLPQHLIHPHSAAPTIPYHPHPPLKRWPNDYTVSELTAGFHAMEALVSQSPNGSSMTQRTAFERVFGSRYVKSTVCRHRGVWRKAPLTLREEFEAMGDVERACWGEFVRRVEGRPPGKSGLAGSLPVEELAFNGQVGDTAGGAGDGILSPECKDFTGDTEKWQNQMKPKGAEEAARVEGPTMNSLQYPVNEDSESRMEENASVYDPTLTSITE